MSARVEYNKQWKRDNRDRVRQHTRTYKTRHRARVRDRERDSQRAWRANNPLFYTWHSMIQRCTNPNKNNYRHYGGRGITVYPGWLKDRKAFERYILETLGPRPEGYSLDRIDNDGGYVPGNLRWASRSDQQRNKGRSKSSPVITASLLLAA
jgi:hypothetical protein